MFSKEMEYWKWFCETVIKERRFTIFNKFSSFNEAFDPGWHTDPFSFFRAMLKTILHDEDFYAFLTKGRSIFRARRVTKGKIFKPEEFSSPPFEKAVSGRMNPQHISFFYGAIDHKTCIYELRPGIEDEIAVASFEVKKDLILFNLAVDVEMRAFSDEKYKEIDDVQFKLSLKEFLNNIQKPIRIADSSYEYLPTQALTEFIRILSFKDLNILPVSDIIEGLIHNENFQGFSGVQFSSNLKRDSKNIVLFKGPEISHPESANQWLEYKGHKVYKINEVKYGFQEI